MQSVHDAHILDFNGEKTDSRYEAGLGYSMRVDCCQRRTESYLKTFFEKTVKVKKVFFGVQKCCLLHVN